MSELKARKFFEAVPTSKEGFYQPGAFVNGYLKSEADKVIAEKDKEIAELEEERRWRKFSEEKPEHHQWILVFYPNHTQFTTGVELRRWDDGCKYDVEEQEVYDKWMPLPSAPKEENK